MAKKGNNITGIAFLAGIIFLLGKCGDDDKPTTAAQSDDNKPVAAYEQPKPLPTKAKEQDDWYNAVQQANNEAAKQGLVAKHPPKQAQTYKEYRPMPEPATYTPPARYSAPATPQYRPSRVQSGTSSNCVIQVDGYYRKNGTYVPPHTRKCPRR